VAKTRYSSDEKVLLRGFGERVRFCRAQKGWSQEELAEQTGLHRTYIGSLERGERNVSLLYIHLISRALAVSLAELVDEPG